MLKAQSSCQFHVEEGWDICCCSSCLLTTAFGGQKLSSPWLREETNGTLLLPSLLQLESHMSQESSIEASINVS